MRVCKTSQSTVLVALAMASLTACSGGGGDAAPVAPTVSTGSLNQVEVNVPLSQSLTATGTGPFTWQITNGSLPNGITLQSSGALTGMPAANQEGQYPFTARVTGPGGSASKDLKLVIIGSTHRVSVVSSTSSTDPLGEANGPSGDHARSIDPGISNTGRFVVFDSAASNLVPNLNPGVNRQVYLHDRLTGITEMVSVSSAGAPGNDNSFVATVSDDGNIVVFDSFANNFVGTDTNNARDVFIRDRAAGTTQRLSQFVNGNQGSCTAPDPLDCNSSDPSVSSDGAIVAFASLSRLTPDDTDSLNDIFVFNRSIPSLQRISVGPGGPGGIAPNDASGSPAISADGRYIAFSSLANNLVAGDVVDSVSDIFVFDRQTGQLRKASVVPGGVASNGDSFGPSISGDGRFVAFWSISSNLLPDGNGFADIFVADMQLNPGNQDFLKLLVNGASQQGDGNSRAPSISRDGKIVAFDSEATNIAGVGTDNNGVRDIYVIDRSCSTTFNSGPCTFKRASIASNGDASNGESLFPALSGDGKYVSYFSDANNLVPIIGDNNGVRDAFVTKP